MSQDLTNWVNTDSSSWDCSQIARMGIHWNSTLFKTKRSWLADRHTFLLKSHVMSKRVLVICKRTWLVGEEIIPTCSATFNLVVNGSKIDRLSPIMVIGARAGCMHWVCYTVCYVDFCTVEGINQRGDVGVESHPNLQYLNVLWGETEGLGLVGTGGTSALSCRGHHGGQWTHWHFYVSQHRIWYQDVAVYCGV